MGDGIPLRCQRRSAQLLDNRGDVELGADNGQVIHEIRTGVYRSSVKLAGIEAGWAKLAPFGGSVPDETRRLVLDTVEGLRDGSISPFTGPIYDQDGGVRIAEGETATDESLQSIDWLVQGVVGRTN